MGFFGLKLPKKDEIVSGLDFWDKKENQQQRQQFAAQRQQQQVQPTAQPQNTLTNNPVTRGISRSFDQINTLDGGRSWQTRVISPTQRDASALEQGYRQFVEPTIVNPVQHSANTLAAGAAGAIGLGQAGYQSAFGTDQSYQNKLNETQQSVRDILDHGWANKGGFGSSKEIENASLFGNAEQRGNLLKPVTRGVAEVGPLVVPGVGGIVAKGASLPVRVGVGALENGLVGGTTDAAMQLANTGQYDPTQGLKATVAGALMGGLPPVLGAGLKGTGRAIVRGADNLSNEGGFVQVGRTPKNIHPEDAATMVDLIDHARGIEKFSPRIAQELELQAAHIAERYGIIPKGGKGNPLTKLADAFDTRLSNDRMQAKGKIWNGITKEWIDAPSKKEGGYVSVGKKDTTEPARRTIVVKTKPATIDTKTNAGNTGRVSVRPAKNGVMQEIKRGLSDQDQVILDELRSIEKQTGEKGLVDKFMYRSNQQRGSNRTANIHLERSKNVKEAIGDQSKKDAEEFSTYANARSELSSNQKATSMSKKDLQAIVEGGAEKHGKRFEALNKHYQELTKMAADAGLIDKKTFEKYTANKDYVRLQRDLDDKIPANSGGRGQGYQLGTTSLKQKRTGSNRKTLDAAEVMAERTQQVHREVAKNKTGTMLADTLEKHGLAKKLVDSKDVKFRKEMWQFLADTREGKKFTERLLTKNKKELSSIQSELDTLNKQGMHESLKKAGAPDKPNIGAKSRVVKVYGHKQGIDALKERGKWTVDEPITHVEARTILRGTKWFNSAIDKPTPALKEFAKSNKLTEREALVRVAMKKTGSDAYHFKGKEVMLNEAKARAEVKKLVGKGVGKGKLQGVTSRGTTMNGRVVRQTIDTLFATDSSKLNSIRKKIALRDPKAAKLIDQVLDLQDDSDAFTGARREAFNAAMARRDASTKNKNTISIFRNGEKEVFEVSPQMKEAMDNINPYSMNVVMQVLSAPGRVFRAGVTGLNPVFIARNLVKDQFGSAINSKSMAATHNPVSFFSGLFAATKDAMGGKNSALYDEFLKHVGDQTSYDLTRNIKDTKRVIGEIRGGKKVKVFNKFKSPIRSLEDIASITEKSTRYQNFKGAYKKAIKEGKPHDQAMEYAALQAWHNSVDFARAGTWGRVINTVLPYWNPSTQGVRQMGRTFKDRPISSTLKGVSLVGVPLVAATAWNMSDPSTRDIYNNIPEFEKDNNLILIPPGTKQNKDGTYDVFKIPLPPGFKDAFMPLRRGMESFASKNPVKGLDIAQDIIQTVSGPIQTGSVGQFVGSFIPQVAKPSIQAAANKDFFTDRSIVPDYMNEATDKNGNPIKDKDKAYSTSSGTARKIGNAIDVSPIKVEKFIKDSGGTVGLNLLNASDTALAKTGKIPQDQVGGQSVSEGFKRSFAQTQGIENHNKSEAAKYFDSLKAATKGLNQNEKDAWTALHPSKKNFTGEQIYEKEAAYDPAARLDIYNRFPKVYDADKKLDAENRKAGKPGNPMFDLENWQLKKVLEKDNLPAGAKDPELSELFKKEWYQNYRSAKTEFFGKLAATAKKEGRSFGSNDNPYPTTPPDVQQAMDTYNALPKGTGQRSGWIKSNPGAWLAMQKQFALTDNWQNIARGKRGLDMTEGVVGELAGYGDNSSSSGYSRSSSGGGSKFSSSKYLTKLSVGGNIAKGQAKSNGKVSVKARTSGKKTGKIKVTSKKQKLA